MCKLLIGSYGTLGIICEMTFKLLPLPEKEATLLFNFARLEEAYGFAREVRNSQFIPSSIETLNAMAVQEMKSPMGMPPNGNYLIAIGLEGVSEGIERQLSGLSDMGKKHGALEALTLNAEKHHAFWIALRDFPQDLKENYPNLISLKSNFLISKWGEMLKSYENIVQEKGIGCAFLCHSGNGILYSYILSEKNLRSKIGSLIEIIEKLKSEAVKNEGNLVVELSPLSIKKKVDVWGQPRSDSQMMCRLKEQIDPTGILNPGRFVGGI
jgi:glycolate oxidase FAD binding subunit